MPANLVPHQQNTPDQMLEQTARMCLDMDIICWYFPHFILQSMHKAYAACSGHVWAQLCELICWTSASRSGR